MLNIHRFMFEMNGLIALLCDELRLLHRQGVWH